MRMDFDYIDGVLLGLVFLGASVMAGIGSFDLFNIGEGVSTTTLAVLSGYHGRFITNDNTEVSETRPPVDFVIRLFQNAKPLTHD